MKPFTKLRTTAAPLTDKGKLMANVDTDMIIPKQFLKTTERVGLAEGLFHELKTLPDGSMNPDFVLNKPKYKGAGVLIAGENFGCGSSREHAPWALLDQGITCVIAPSYADIFFNNSGKNGILALRLPQEICEKLAEQAGGGNSVFEIDLEHQTVTGPDGTDYRFEIDPGRKDKLLNGLDDIAMTLQRAPDIERFEAQRKLTTPWLETIG
ncbi:MAG: 3-isopropylmalate dehydratase small subunit [Henriciella sp.]|nr:3-isopropylmalate dehydratase small subunit [Henriciella sp.]